MNILGLCYLHVRKKTYKQPTVASPLKSLTSTYLTKLLHLLNEPYDITSLQDLMILSF